MKEDNVNTAAVKKTVQYPTVSKFPGDTATLKPMSDGMELPYGLDEAGIKRIALEDGFEWPEGFTGFSMTWGTLGVSLSDRLMGGLTVVFPMVVEYEDGSTASAPATVKVVRPDVIPARPDCRVGHPVRPGDVVSLDAPLDVTVGDVEEFVLDEATEQVDATIDAVTGRIRAHISEDAVPPAKLGEWVCVWASVRYKGGVVRRFHHRFDLKMDEGVGSSIEYRSPCELPSKSRRKKNAR